MKLYVAILFVDIYDEFFKDFHTAHWIQANNLNDVNLVHRKFRVMQIIA